MKILFLLLVIGTVMWTCKSDNKVVGEPAPPKSEVKDQNPSNQLAKDPVNWTFLTDGIFGNRHTVIIGQDPKINSREGHWIDFKDEQFYAYGVNDKQLYDGEYFYNNDTKILLLKPNNMETPISEWLVKHQNDNMVWIGTKTYGNNNTQIQWIRRAN